MNMTFMQSNCCVEKDTILAVDPSSRDYCLVHRSYDCSILRTVNGLYIYLLNRDVIYTNDICGPERIPKIEWA